MATAQTIVIIGGSSGIGRAVAVAAARRGQRVRAVGRNGGLLAVLARQFGVETAQADVRDPEALAQALAGLEHIDQVLKTAGTIIPTPILTTDLATLRAPFEERVMGAMNVVRAAAPLMTDGAFLFVTGDLVERPIAGLGSVTAAATAVEALVRTWVLELAPLRFNILSPGVIDTPLQDRLFGSAKAEMLAQMAEKIPLQRVGQPDEAARAALELLDNRFINGATLNVDGGMRLH